MSHPEHSKHCHCVCTDLFDLQAAIEQARAIHYRHERNSLGHVTGLAQRLQVINGVSATSGYFNDVIYLCCPVTAIHACLTPYLKACLA